MKKKTKKKKRNSARRTSRKAAPRSRAKTRGRRKVAGSRKKAAGSRKKVAARKRVVARKRTKPAMSFRKAVRPARAVLDKAQRDRDLGPNAAGQSGDTEGLSGSAIADSESVKQLVEEGQPFEAGIVSGVEKAGDADKGGVRTRQVPEDDVPQEYLDKD